MDKQREGFEKAYEPNPNKSPFTEVKFDEVARVYKPLDQFNPRIASSLNAAWYGWRIRQAEVDGLQAKVDELQKRVEELTVGCGLQRDHIKGLEAELKKAWTTVDQEGHKKHGLVMLLKFIKEHFEMNDLDKAMPRVYEELEQALKGGEE